VKGSSSREYLTEGLHAEDRLHAREEVKCIEEQQSSSEVTHKVRCRPNLCYECEHAPSHAIGWHRKDEHDQYDRLEYQEKEE